MIYFWRLFISVWLNGFKHLSFAFYNDFHGSETFIHVEGKVNVEYGFVEGVFKTIPRDYCDEGFMFPYVMCDIYITQHAIVLGEIMNYNQFQELKAMINLEVLHEWVTPNLQDKFRKLKADISNTTSHYFPNDNTPNTYFPKFFKSKMYFQVICICSYIVDEDVIGKDELMWFCLYKHFPTVGEIKYYIPRSRYSTTYVKYLAQPKCQTNYFRPTCWLRCEPSPNRYFCDHDGYQVCTGYYEGVIFGYKYYVTDNLYTRWNMEKLYIHKCLFYNKCALSMEATYSWCHVSNYLCYPLKNNTFTCLEFYPMYIISKYSLTVNGTYDSLVNEEYVHVSVILYGKENATVHNNSICQWEIPEINGKYVGIDSLSNISILYLGKLLKYGIYYFNLKCEIGKFRTFIFPRAFVIYELPTKISIENTSYNKKYIYIGQYIDCLSNAVPQNASEHSLLLLTNNFNGEMKRRYKYRYNIPLSSDTGFCIMQCTLSFIFPDGRPTFNKSEMFYYEIRSYVEFYWLRKFKNVYTVYDWAGCRHLAYFIGKTIVKVTIGKGDIEVEPSYNFSTFTKIGGLYQFMCILQPFVSDMNLYFRPSMFEIHIMPTTICMMPFFAFGGSTIRFGDDGYPADYGIYLLTFFLNFKLIKDSRIRSIKIPYFLPFQNMKIVCNLTFQMGNDSRTLSMEKYVVLENDTKKYSGYSYQEYICAMNIDEPIENAIQLSESAILFSGEIFILVANPNKSDNSLLPWYYWCLCGTIFLKIWLQASVLRYHIKFVRKQMVKCSLNKKLKQISIFIIESRTPKPDLFQKKTTLLTTEFSSISNVFWFLMEK